MSGTIDTSVFSGSWAFRCLDQKTPAALKSHLLNRGVRRAWVASSEAVLYPDPMQGNEPLFTAVKPDPFFLPVAVIDVTLATWRRDAQTCLDRWNCAAFKLVPNYHQYELSDARVGELVALAQAANIPVCVQMRMMDERSHHPLMKVPGVDAKTVAELAKRHPDARFLGCGAYQAELKAFQGIPNVWAEISAVESGQAPYHAVSTLGSNRLCFGSHSPFFYFEAVAAKLEVGPVDISEADIQNIRETNAASLIRDAKR